MERLFRKVSQRYKRAREETVKWEDLQKQLVALFGSAVAIIERLPILADERNYGVLGKVPDIARDMQAKQVESLESLFLAMQKTLEGIDKGWKSLEKLWQDSCGLLKAEKPQPTPKQLRQSYGIQPSLKESLDGLEALYVMHRDEYHLKVQIVSALSYESRSSDMEALQVLLIDQPNIPSIEVQHIFNTFLAGETS